MGQSLQERNYRLFFYGHALSVTGTWMQRVAQDWLVLELTDSALAIGIATALQFVPMLVLGVWGGVLVDRLDRHRTILVTQALSGALALALAVTTLTGSVSLGLVYGLALGLGLVSVVDIPARQTFVTDLVPPEKYINAQSLNSLVHNVGRLVGPAIAGLLIAAVGVGVAFAANAASFLAVIGALLLMRRATFQPVTRSRREKGQAREGLRYAWRHPEIKACLVLVGVVAVFGQNFRVVLPLMANTLGGGAELYGYLTSALGLGSVIGAAVSATRVKASIWALLLWSIAFGLANIVTSAATSVLIALSLLFGVGITNIMFNTLARTLLLLEAAPGMEGRVIALHGLLAHGSVPVGSLLMGYACEVAGPRVAMAGAGILAVIAGLALLPWLRALRRGGATPGAPAGAVAPSGSTPEPTA
jgi:predicted MFS family arabinose efflux permease